MDKFVFDIKCVASTNVKTLLIKTVIFRFLRISGTNKGTNETLQFDLADDAVTSAKIADGSIQLADLDTAITGEISANTATNTGQDTGIATNTTAIASYTSANTSQDTSISVNTAAIATLGLGISDDADGVEIAFTSEFDYDDPNDDPDMGLVKSLGLNGTDLVADGNDPTVTLGGQARAVLYTADIPDTNPALQQVIVELPASPMASHHKVKLSNVQGTSEAFVPLGEILTSPPAHDGSAWAEATHNAGWSSREGHTFLVYDNKMWVIGGISNSGRAYDDVWSSSDGINWTEVTGNAGWSGPYGHASLVYDNKMWGLGGSNTGEAIKMMSGHL